jgi:catechol 2,3-dioxygenase
MTKAKGGEGAKRGRSAKREIATERIMNSDTIIHPKLQHIGMTTSNLDAMLEWYRAVLGMSVVHRTASATGEKAAGLAAAWTTNDEENHRLAFAALPGLTRDPERGKHPRLQHVAFEYVNLDDLLGTYVRLKDLGILPVLCTDGGSQIAFYYEDPDHNSVELNVNNYNDDFTATEHLQHSPEFAANPLGCFVDPDKLIAARRTGASHWDLHKRIWAHEFAPAQPYDPRKLL